MLYHYDSDLHGVDSIRKFITEGKVMHIPCPTFKMFSQRVSEMIPVMHKELTEGGEPVAIIDTISQLSHTTRMDHKLGTDPSADLWEKRLQYMGDDKNYLTVYDYATDVIIRTIKNMRAVEATFDDKKVYQPNPPSPLPKGWTRKSVRIIVIAHEAEQEDVSVGFKKRAPYINKALYKSLAANCSDMFRLTSTEEDIPYPDGSTNPDGSAKVYYSKDTRFLTIRKTENCITKFQVEREFVEALPGMIINPTMRKIWRVLHKKPSFLVIYGAEGTGKTTLAVSEVEPAPSTAKKQQTDNAKDTAAA